MPINFIKINGEHPELDYQILEDSFKEQFGRTCADATIFVLNSFPVLISAESDIDFLLIIVIKNIQGNYISFYKNDRNVYLHNLIIPVKFINSYVQDKIELEGDNILVDETELDFEKEITSLKLNLKSYLKNRCEFEDDVYIHPLFFIQHTNSFATNNCLVGKQFDFKGIEQWLQTKVGDIFISYKPWKIDQSYSNINNDIARVVDQASFDSITGYLTKKKVDQIGLELNRADRLKNHLSHSMIMIKGKAGSGKTSALLSLNIHALKSGFNTYFLTYNKVLVYDISQIIRSVINNLNIEKVASVDTLHSFFYHLSKKLGVLHILSKQRIDEVVILLKTRLRTVYDLLALKIDFRSEINFENLKTYIQNENSFDKGTKEEGIDFMNFLKWKKVDSISTFKRLSREYYELKKGKIAGIASKEIFLSDYYGVLENTLYQITDSDGFYDEHQIRDKYDLLDLASGIGNMYKNEDGIIDKSNFKIFMNRRVGGSKRNRIVFIDEAQDCHRLEKEILAEIFGTNRLVVANGGKEQLIRHVELCNWEIIRGDKIDFQSRNKRNKSYRLKPRISDFCNFFGGKFKIDLNLESMDTHDSGELIFDFRKNISDENMIDVFNYLNQKGQVHGCKEYESILVLLETLQNNSVQIDSQREAVRINEYGNIVLGNEYDRGKWGKIESLENNGFQFYDATCSDKSGLGLPYPSQIRLIYYESCRGLEAWSVACFDLDKFFETKFNEEEAEKFLVDSEKDKLIQNLFITNETRRKMYAATWVLMALTRSIDTLYVHINNENSLVGELINQYIRDSPNKVKVYR